MPQKSETIYDVFIAGGGINGVGVARDAAGRGYSVCLCEMNDFASGTSSSSTKLIHGGLRYLEHYKFRLVQKSLKEREVLLNMAPHIIKPMRFILPHKKGMRPKWLLRLGLALYDFRRYEEALLVFKKRSEITIDDSEESSVSLIWQGHMLDLLGKREEAISIYMKVSDLDVKNSTSHSQYELTFSPGVYASERIKTPFKRIENLDPD